MRPRAELRHPIISVDVHVPEARTEALSHPNKTLDILDIGLAGRRTPCFHERFKARLNRRVYAFQKDRQVRRYDLRETRIVGVRAKNGIPCFLARCVVEGNVPAVRLRNGDPLGLTHARHEGLRGFRVPGAVVAHKTALLKKSLDLPHAPFRRFDEGRDGSGIRLDSIAGHEMEHPRRTTPCGLVEKERRVFFLRLVDGHRRNRVVFSVRAGFRGPLVQRYLVELGISKAPGVRALAEIDTEVSLHKRGKVILDLVRLAVLAATETSVAAHRDVDHFLAHDHVTHEPSIV